MKRALVAIPPGALDAVESLRALGELGARLGEQYALGVIVERLKAIPDARLARRDVALRELATFCEPASDRKRAEAMAAKLSRYEAGRWRRDRAYDTPPPKYGEEDRALFKVLQNSPGSGAPREKTIRTMLGKTLPIPLAHESTDLVLEATENRSAALPPLKPTKAETLAVLVKEPDNAKFIGAWIINEDAEAQLDLIGSGGGSASTNGMYFPAGTGGNEFALVKGQPVVVAEQCPTLGTPGDIVLADLSQYILIEIGVQAAVSMDVSFDSDESVFRFRWRGDGKPAWASPITPYDGARPARRSSRWRRGSD
jgi:hypothetical protein